MTKHTTKNNINSTSKTVRIFAEAFAVELPSIYGFVSEVVMLL